MKLRVFVGGFTLAAGTVACVCSVQAADLPMRPAPAPVAPVAYAPPVYNWSGFYIGGHIGGGFENSSWSDPFTGSNDNFNNSGLSRRRPDRRATRSSTGSSSASKAISAGPARSRAPAPIRWATAITTSPQWTSTVTGRVGAAFDRLLVYGKGGVAFADDKSTLTPVGGATRNRYDDADRLDGRRRSGICAHGQLVGRARIRLSRLRFEALSFDARPVHDKCGSQCSRSEGRLRLQVRAVKAAARLRTATGTAFSFSVAVRYFPLSLDY